MIRTRFEALFVRRAGEQWGGGHTRVGLRGNPRMIVLSMALGLAAFASACIGLGQCVFTLLLAASALPMLVFVAGVSRGSRQHGLFVEADAQYLDLDHIRVRWTEVDRLEHRLVASRFGEAPCIAVDTTKGSYLIGMASLPEVDQRLEELRALHARGQGSESDVPDALRSMKQRKPERS